MRIILVCAALALAACGAHAGGSGVDGGSGGSDAGTPPAAPVEPVCTKPAKAGDAFALDPDGKSVISPRAAFDGTVWLAYSRAGDGSDNFDVAVTRLACDGSTLLAPKAIATTPNSNDVDPALAIGSDRVLVAWSGDDSSQQPNLSLQLAALGFDGSVKVAPLALETTKDGNAVSANVWQASVMSLKNGQFGIAGSRGIVGQPGGFHAFVQKVGSDGKRVGDTAEAPDESPASQENPVLLAGSGESLLLSWTRDNDDDAPSVRESQVYADGSFSQPVDVIGNLGEYPTGAQAAWAPHAFLAVQGQLDGNAAVIVKDATALDPDKASLTLSVASAGSFGPTVAVSPDGGAVAWFAQNAAGARKIVAQSFTYDGTAFVAGTQVSVTNGNAAPSAPAIVHVADHLYFVAWSEGTSPDLKLMGRFVELP